MTDSQSTIHHFLKDCYPYSLLSPKGLQQVVQESQLVNFKMGRVILTKEYWPTHVVVVYQGAFRVLGQDPIAAEIVPLELLEPRDSFGWLSLVRGTPCETISASENSVAIAIPFSLFQTLVTTESAFEKSWHHKLSVLEIFEIVGCHLEQQPNAAQWLKGYTVQSLASTLLSEAKVQFLSPQEAKTAVLDPTFDWWMGNSSLDSIPLNTPLQLPNWLTYPLPSQPIRLIGIPAKYLRTPPTTAPTDAVTLEASPLPEAPDLRGEPVARIATPGSKRFPWIRGQGLLPSALACLEMLCQYWRIPFRKDPVARILKDQLDRFGTLSLSSCGGVAEVIGLRTQFIAIAPTMIHRLPLPALISWQDRFAVVYSVDKKSVLLADPAHGLLKLKTSELAQTWQESATVVVVQPRLDGPRERFNLMWFLPIMQKYRFLFFEILLASFLIQLLGLSNPLTVQLIIDQVFVNSSFASLNTLGLLLVIFAMFEALLTSLRTYLLADTSNRLDISFGATVIDHLIRLPLRFFEKRAVGELSSRVAEMERIRQFLTGTALTIVLDLFFSLFYIALLVVYNPLLTLIALGALPVMGAVTVIVTPIIRRQLRIRAERNAATQAYLVEVLTGIQTVKTQNLEIKVRWQWYERFARYISSGFKAVIIGTTAQSANDFLNKLSQVLILWYGAYLVIDNKLTLGQLIAFRIIAGYVTNPLLRLSQSWQSFQETSLSIERLADILDSPQEAETSNLTNIPMPTIQGRIQYEQVSFRFNPHGPLQLNQISIDIPSGSFVGIVGQSGSGKSTFTKLLARLYNPSSGRILLDGYDINKVELYSLRRQIGIVPQDPMLFDSTVIDNLMLINPDATGEQVIDAAKAAAAHDFIMELPAGYSTSVGERGAALSGGQRQRIAIARTLLQNPNLLILDEATNALDYETERRVCLNLLDRKSQHTILFITHRLNSVRGADLVLMMDQGSIVEKGTHDELMNLKGRYYSLYRQQESGQ